MIRHFVRSPYWLLSAPRLAATAPHIAKNRTGPKSYPLRTRCLWLCHSKVMLWGVTELTHGSIAQCFVTLLLSRGMWNTGTAALASAKIQQLQKLCYPVVLLLVNVISWCLFTVLSWRISNKISKAVEKTSSFRLLLIFKCLEFFDIHVWQKTHWSDMYFVHNF